MWFHAHIYFENRNLADARELLNHAKKLIFFESAYISEKPIGPHPTGMIELLFNDQNYSLAVDWIKVHHGNFSVLIHQNTGDDMADHSNNILWFGEPRTLNFSFFELIKDRPELRIHK